MLRASNSSDPRACRLGTLSGEAGKSRRRVLSVVAQICIVRPAVVKPIEAASPDSWSEGSPNAARPENIAVDGTPMPSAARRRLPGALIVCAMI